MATTFAAISRDPAALQATIEKSPPTIDTAVSSFRVQRPFLADFADLSRRLRPAVNELPRSLPAINRAFRVGTPVLPRTVDLNNRLRKALRRARGPVREPEHAARDPRPAHHAGGHPPGARVRRALPDGLQLLQLLLPPARRAPVDGRSPGGTVQTPGRQDAEQRAAQHLRRHRGLAAVGHAAGRRPVGAEALRPCSSAAPTRRPTSRRSTPRATPTARTARTAGSAARSRPGARYGPGALLRRHADAAATRRSLINNFPILSGGTFKSRELGINNLQDVDKLR